MTLHHKIQMTESGNDVVKRVGRLVCTHPDTGRHSYRVGHQTFFWLKYREQLLNQMPGMGTANFLTFHITARVK